jgi:hypothetical protein
MKLRLIDDWRQAWRYYSTWAFAALLVMPDAYTAASAIGLFDGGAIPPVAEWSIRGLAGLGIVARVVRQVRPEKGSHAQP